ncbi:DUF3750 domain-containing protein [Pseudomonas reactans]|nr:DUF3750 domain-containing protein [Pseudomonas reactans]
MMVIKWVPLCIVCILFLSLGCSYVKSSQGKEQQAVGGDWSTARRDSAGIAPNPVQLKSTAIIQIYAAPTYGWRGLVAVHPWIIYKRAGDTQFTRYDVVSWGSSNVVRRDYAIPDGYWFGSKPKLLADRRGERAETLIPQIEAAIKSYPYPHTYHAWPGPNSNTFMAHIGREVPALKLDMPSNAIGKDYRGLTNPIGLPPSGRGLQVSVLGVLGFTLGVEEGVEVNLLGLNLGVDIKSPALRLPFVGRVGFDNPGAAEL